MEWQLEMAIGASILKSGRLSKIKLNNIGRAL